MSIVVMCVYCQRELTEAGGLLFSPPPVVGEPHVSKHHLCRACYDFIIRFLEDGRRAADGE